MLQTITSRTKLSSSDTDCGTPSGMNEQNDEWLIFVSLRWLLVVVQGWCGANSWNVKRVRRHKLHRIIRCVRELDTRNTHRRIICNQNLRIRWKQKKLIGQVCVCSHAKNETQREITNKWSVPRIVKMRYNIYYIFFILILKQSL